MKIRVIIKIILFGFFIVVANAYGRTFKIAAIYPENGWLSGCMYITDSVITSARKKGVDVKLISLDDKGSVIGAFLAAKKAVQLKVDAVVGTETSEQALIVSDILNKAGIPFISPTAIHPKVSGNKKYVITILENAKRLSKLTAAYILKTSHPDRITIIRNLSMKYSNYNANAVAENINKISPFVKVNFLNIINGNENVSYITKEIIRLKPNVIYMPIYNKEVSALLINLAKSPFPLTIYINGGPTIIRQSKYYKLILKNSPQLTFYVITLWAGKISGSSQEEYKFFLNKKASGYKNDFGVVMAYDAIKFIISVLQEHPNIRGMQFVNQAKKRSFTGITGYFYFNKKGETVRIEQDIFYKLGRDNE